MSIQIGSEFQEGIAEREAAYWKKKLSGKVPALDLPVDRARAAGSKPKPDSALFTLPPGSCRALEQMALSKGLNTDVILLAIFEVLLFRYTGQEDLIVAAHHAPGIPDGETMVENTILLRSRISGETRFSEFLEHLQQVVSEARAHAALPLQKVLEELSSEMDPSPLLQVMFHFNQPAKTFANTAEEPFCSDLSLGFEEHAGALHGRVDFHSELFEGAGIQRLIGHFQTLLQAVLNQPEEAIGRLAMLTQSERDQLLHEWNTTQTDFPRDKCIHHLFQDQVQRTPDSVALVYRDRQITYKELNASADQLAKKLRAQGVGPDVCVGICMLRSPEMIVALYAVHKAGGAYLPMDPTYPSERLAFMIEDAQAPILLTQKVLEGVVPRGNAKVLLVDTMASDSATPPFQESKTGGESEPDSLAYVIYTSGSTGKPKGVMVRHRNVVNFFAGMDRAIGQRAGTWLAVTSISFDISVLELFWTLTRGFKVLLQEDDASTVRKVFPGSGSSSSERFTISDQITRHSVTHLQCTPSLATAMLDDPKTEEALRKVKMFLFGGEPLPASLVERLKGFGEILNMYGPTETTVWSTFQPVTRNPGPISIGRPIANTQIYILDSHLQPLPVGVAGDLFIGGEGVTRGYLKRPELTEERFIPDPFSRDSAAKMYRTGDLARYRADGTIDFLGRRDQQVKVRGHRIELGEIEAAIRQQPGVKESVVSVWHAGWNDVRLVGYFIPQSGANPQIAEIRRGLKNKLPDYMVPQVFRKLEKLPLTPNGKVDRNALPVPETSPLVDAQPMTTLPGQNQSTAAPETTTESAGGRVLPVSEAQREIWLGAQVSNEISCSFNQSVMVSVKGPLHRELLMQSIDWLCERHEALRVTFAPSGATQQVHHHMTATTDFVDISAAPLIEAHENLEAMLRHEAEKPFDLVRGPLFRVRIVKLAEQEHAILFTLHHLVCDGTSLAILLAELGEKYSALSNGKPGPDKLEQNYGAFIEGEASAERSPERARSEAFWLEECSRPCPKLSLPGKKAPGGRRRFTGEGRIAWLNSALAERLRRTAAQHRCTPTALLLAGFYVLLHRLSGHPEILVGLPITVRSGPGSEKLVGHCVNFLPLRFSFEGDPTFSEHLKRVWTLLIRAIEHRNFTLGSLLEKLNGTQEYENLPIPSVMFNLDWVLQPVELAGVTTDLKANPYARSRFDLSVGVVEKGREIGVCCQYSPELLEADTVQRWLQHYETLLSAFVLQPTLPLSHYPALCLPDGSVEIFKSDSPAVNSITTSSVAEAAPVSREEEMTETEKALAQIWREVVILEEVGRHDNFFEVGGHSLLATKVISRMTKTFKVEIPVRVIFEAPTIAELGEAVTRAQREQPNSAPAMIRPRQGPVSDALLQKLEKLSEAELQELLRNPKLKNIL